MELVNSSVYTLPGTDFQPRLTIEQVILAIENVIGCKLKDVCGKSRIREKVSARQKFAYILRWYGFSYKSIGVRIKRDHSTIVYSIKTIENDMILDKELRKWIQTMQTSLTP